MMLKQSISRGARARRAAHGLLACLALGMGLLIAGCDRSRGLQVTAEVDEPHYRRGVQMARSGQNQIALEAFLKVIDKRGGDAPESHLEAGQLYLNHIKDPIAAIYHFRKFLELRSNSPQAPQVRQMIDRAIKDFARTLPAQPMEAQVERLDLLDMLEKLRAENATLRAELARSGRAPPAPAVTAPAQPRAAADSLAVQPVVPIEPDPAAARVQPQRPGDAQAPSPGPGGGRTYVVQARDTLYGISTKVYGTGSRWTAILEANRDQMRSERDLKVGMVLRIP